MTVSQIMRHNTIFKTILNFASNVHIQSIKLNLNSINRVGHIYILCTNNFSTRKLFPSKMANISLDIIILTNVLAQLCGANHSGYWQVGAATLPNKISNN